MIMTALRTGVAAAGPAAGLVRGVVLDIALGGGPAAHRAGAGGVPHLDQVLQLDPGVVAAGLVPVVAGVGGQGLQGDDQARRVAGGAQPPGAVPAGRPVLAGRGEGEPRWAGSGAFPVTTGFGPDAAVPDGVAVLVSNGQAPGRLRVARGCGGQVPG